MGWGLGRFALNARVGPAGLALLLTTLPWMLSAVGNFYSVMLEAVLLCHALAEQALGRRATALVLVTAAAFCKPSMPLFYGFLLVLLLLHDAWMARSQGFSLRAFLPATIVAIVMSCTLGLAYGPGPLLYSMVPIRGAGVYRANNYGFFGLGRDFWAPEGVRWTYYLGSPIGSWILASVVLVLGALEALASPMEQPGSDRDRPARRSEITVCSCALASVVRPSLLRQCLVLGEILLPSFHRRVRDGEEVSVPRQRRAHRGCNGCGWRPPALGSGTREGLEAESQELGVSRRLGRSGRPPRVVRDHPQAPWLACGGPCDCQRPWGLASRLPTARGVLPILRTSDREGTRADAAANDLR